MKFRLVKLDNFYANIQSPDANQAFLQMAKLRAEGYGPEYPQGYLPIDQCDYIVCHYILCIEEGKEWVPISCWRQTSLKRCDYYKVTPSFISTVKDAQIPEPQKAMLHLVEECRKANRDLFYLGGFTILKPYRERGLKTLGKTIKEILTATTVMDQMATQCVMISGGAILLKTHLYLQKMGYVPFEWEGQSVPSFQKVSAFGAPMILMKLKEFSRYSWDCYKKHQELLNSQIVIGGEAKGSAPLQQVN